MRALKAAWDRFIARAAVVKPSWSTRATNDAISRDVEREQAGSLQPGAVSHGHSLCRRCVRAGVAAVTVRSQVRIEGALGQSRKWPHAALPEARAAPGRASQLAAALDRDHAEVGVSGGGRPR